MANERTAPGSTAPAMAGFSILLTREIRQALRLRSLLLSLVVWGIILNGFLLITIAASQELANNPDSVLLTAEEPEAAEIQSMISDPSLSVSTLLMMMGFALAIYAVINLQDAVIQEKLTGTAAWVLSKPVTRLAFIVSKLAAHVVRLLLIVIPQIVIAILLLRFVGNFNVNLAVFLLGVPLVLVFVLFFSALTLLLGTVSDSRGFVIGIPLALLLLYQPISSLLAPIMSFLPYALVLSGAPGAAPLVLSVVMGGPISNWMPLVTTILIGAVLTVLATWNFSRQEL